MNLEKNNIFEIQSPVEIQGGIYEKLDNKFKSNQIKKVLLIQPSDTDKKSFNYAAGKRKRLYNYPPYGLALLASQLRKNSIEVDILNLNHETLKHCVQSLNEENFDFDNCWQQSLRKKIQSFQPDFVGITSMFSQSHDILVEISNYVNSIDSKIMIGAGGVHVTNSVSDKKTFDKFVNELKSIDYFFLYEADLSFTRFVQNFNTKKTYEDLSQIIIRLEKNNFLFFKNRCHPTGEELNTIPALDLIQTEEVSKWGKIGSFFCFKPKETKMTTVLSNRGCRAQCTFCSVRTFNGVGVRRRKVDSVIEELKILQNEYNIGHIMWLDDDFLYNTEESLKLFNAIIKENIKITWDCTNGLIASACKDEVIHAARDSGCIGVSIGMESGNREILKNIRKPGTVENFLKAAEVFRKYPEIVARVFLMIGFPNESYKQILDTINVANEMNLDWYNVGILQPLPNTPIFDSMVSSGLIDLESLKFSDIRYNSGGLGKHKKERRDMLSVDFINAFDVSLESVPEKEKLDEIWAYMNFHLNFKKLFEEDRELKLKQKYQYVENITDLVSPENALALYFLGYLEYKIYGSSSKETYEKLKNRLREYPYWIERFEQYKISPSHLKDNSFNLMKNILVKK